MKMRARVTYLSAALLMLFVGCRQQLSPTPAVTAESTVRDGQTETLTSKQPQSGAGTQRILACRFYEEKRFLQTIKDAESYQVDGVLMCATIPHHLLASNMIAATLNTARARRPDIDTVVIVAPIHERKSVDVATTRASWDTSSGLLRADDELPGLFIETLGAREDDALLESDHSASALIPFVAHYFPEARVACLLVSASAEQDIPARAAALFVKASAQKNCLFLFSVDFSHYLDPAKTEACDVQTREAVLTGDINLIQTMSNDNMDAPMSVCTFLFTTALLSGTVSELDHSNSMEILRRSFTDKAFDNGLTSYFIFAGCLPDSATNS